MIPVYEGQASTTASSVPRDALRGRHRPGQPRSQARRAARADPRRALRGADRGRPRRGAHTPVWSTATSSPRTCCCLRPPPTTTPTSPTSGLTKRAASGSAMTKTGQMAGHGRPTSRQSRSRAARRRRAHRRLLARAALSLPADRAASPTTSPAMAKAVRARQRPAAEAVGLLRGRACRPRWTDVVRARDGEGPRGPLPAPAGDLGPRRRWLQAREHRAIAEPERSVATGHAAPRPVHGRGRVWEGVRRRRAWVLGLAAAAVLAVVAAVALTGGGGSGGGDRGASGSRPGEVRAGRPIALDLAPDHVAALGGRVWSVTADVGRLAARRPAHASRRPVPPGGRSRRGRVCRCRGRRRLDLGRP